MHEDDRRDAALPCLARIFSARRGSKIPPLYAVSSDGHKFATHGAGTIVVEFGNGITGISATPHVELARLYSTEARRRLYPGWRAPCLGLTIVGELYLSALHGYCYLTFLGYELTFYAVLTIDHRIRLVHLTPGFSCLRTACDGRDRRALYSAFTAASVLQAHILQDVENLLHNLPPGLISDPARRFTFPAVSKLRKYPPTSDEYLNFKIGCFFPGRQPNRLLYAAEMPDKELILINFSQHYSIELHDFCAKSGHAPRILVVWYRSGIH